ncbi:MAG: ArsR family transcriptional regulator [Gammaproteobacteria bacterium]|nr:ArsR family transcriptional regulator [Gammaproteobacteria bacterium]
MPKDFRQTLSEDRRLVILRLLAEVDGYEANSSVLQAALESYGHTLSRDSVHTELAWLSEQGLTSTAPLASIVVARLTPRGLDVAQGRATVPGVKRPGPGA